MTASLAIVACAAVLVALIVRDVFVRALGAQVRKAELAVQEAREAEVGALAKRLEAVEGELRGVVSAVQFGKAMRR